MLPEPSEQRSNQNLLGVGTCLPLEDFIKLSVHQFKVKIAKSLAENIRGLLGTKTAYPLLLSTRLGIHTFGMSYPIDVLILDSNNIVKFIRENLPPNSMYFWNFVENKVLELPAGTIKTEQIKKQDKIKLVSTFFD